MIETKDAIEAAQRLLKQDLFRLQTGYRLPWDQFFEWICYRIFIAKIPECKDTEIVREKTKELKGFPC